MYEGEAVNGSQMDMNRKTCDIRTREETFISRHILHQHWYTCPIALPVRRNAQQISLLTVTSATSAPGRSATFERPWENFLTQLCTALRDRHFPPSTGNISLWISFALCPFVHKKIYNVMLLFSNTLLKQGHHFDYWNQPLNMRMRVCYVDCHEARLCWYLVMGTENLLRPLQLFYFHLWFIYWLCLLLTELKCARI
jgi:hypothetical protein